MKKLFTVFLLSFLITSCEESGNIRRFLVQIQPLFDSELKERNLRITPDTNGFSAIWTAVADFPVELSITDDRQSKIYSVELAPFSSTWNTSIASGISFQQYKTYTLSLRPVDEVTGSKGPVIASETVAPSVIYCNPASSAVGGTGSSFNSPIKSLNTALDMVESFLLSGSDYIEIRLAEGSFYPVSNSSNTGGNNPEDYNFTVYSNTRLIGGYNVSNGQITGRTTLTGSQTNGAHSRHVMIIEDDSDNWGLANLVFTGGNAGSSSTGSGLLAAQGSGGRITNCVFTGNQAPAVDGATIFVVNSYGQWIFDGCSFSGNINGYGGDYYFYNCTFPPIFEN